MTLLIRYRSCRPSSSVAPEYWHGFEADATVVEAKDCVGPAAMNMTDHLEVREGICEFRPRGESSLVEVMELITRAIAYCRCRRIDKLLVVTTGLVGVPIPTFVDRFLMVEEWAHAAEGRVVGAIVASPEYIHPEKFGVQVAADLGLVADVFTSEADALRWLSNYRLPG